MKDLDLTKSLVQISHTDMDGSGSAIIAKLVFPDRSIMHVSYGGIQEALEALSKSDKEQLLITDLKFVEEDFKVLEKLDFEKIVYIDHHLYDVFDPLKYKSDKLRIYINTNACATKLAYAYFKQYEDISKYKEFVEIVNAFDIWVKDSEYFSMGKDYNRLFWRLGQKQFEYQFFKDPELDDKKKELIKNIHIDIKEYFKNNRDKVIFDDDIVISFFDDYIGELQEVFKKQKVIINLMSNTHYSFRISDEVPEEKAEKIRDILCYKIFKPEETITSGGHLRAFGLTVIPTDMYQHKVCIEKMGKVVEKILAS